MNEKRYKVIEDLQGGEFGMGRNYTIEQWRKQAIEWCWADDLFCVARILYKLESENVLDEIADFWNIKFGESNADEITETDRTDYEDETLQDFYMSRFANFTREDVKFWSYDRNRQEIVLENKTHELTRFDFDESKLAELPQDHEQAIDKLYEYFRSKLGVFNGSI